MNSCILYDKMATFVLNEVDYAVKNGYSRRARRYMRRSLSKELKEIEINMNCNKECIESSDEDPLDLSINIYKHKTPACISAMYVCMLFAFYVWASYNMYDFIDNRVRIQNHSNILE